jgi:SAM-dependent methyltransferase
MAIHDAYFRSGYYNATIHAPSKKYYSIEKFFKDHNVEKVLDAGCGAGRHTYLLAKAGFDVYGFDISKDALRINRSILKKHKTGAALMQLDMSRQWPYKNNFFDAVFASRTMYQSRVAGIRRNIRAVNRVLKSSGYFFWEGPTYKTTRKRFLYERIKTVEPGTWSSIGGPYNGNLYHRFRSKTEVLSFLNRFKIIRFDFRGKTFSLLAKKL